MIGMAAPTHKTLEQTPMTPEAGRQFQEGLETARWATMAKGETWIRVGRRQASTSRQAAGKTTTGHHTKIRTTVVSTPFRRAAIFLLGHADVVVPQLKADKEGRSKCQGGTTGSLEAQKHPERLLPADILLLVHPRAEDGAGTSSLTWGPQLRQELPVVCTPIE